MNILSDQGNAERYNEWMKHCLAQDLTLNAKRGVDLLFVGSQPNVSLTREPVGGHLNQKMEDSSNQDRQWYARKELRGDDRS